MARQKMLQIKSTLPSHSLPRNEQFPHPLNEHILMNEFNSRNFMKKIRKKQLIYKQDNTCRYVLTLPTFNCGLGKRVLLYSFQLVPPRIGYSFVLLYLFIEYDSGGVVFNGYPYPGCLFLARSHSLPPQLKALLPSVDQTELMLCSPETTVTSCVSRIWQPQTKCYAYSSEFLQQLL